MSMAPMKASLRVPGGVLPGQRMTNGTWAESSYGVALEARRVWCSQVSFGLP